MIVKGDDKEAVLLDNCLGSVAEYVDGIFITITQQNTNVREVAEKYNAVICEYEWKDDFADARNFSFSQVTEDYEYILWLDSDDLVRGANKLKDICNAHDEVDGFIMTYLYEFNDFGTCLVAHDKTRIIRKGTTEWYGNGIHEDFRPLRELKLVKITDIEIIHTSKHERKVESAERNIRISRKWTEEQPQDPRSWWNLANSLKSFQYSSEVVDAYEKFIGLTESESEKFIAFLAIADVYLTQNDPIRALEVTRRAIGLFPEYPDGYIQLGRVFRELNQLEKAEKYFRQSLSLPPAIDEYIVFNPRNYDFNPLHDLADVYWKLNKPHESLKCLEACKKIAPYRDDLDEPIEMIRKAKELSDNVYKEIKKLSKLKNNNVILKRLAKLPVEMLSHPAVCQFRNEKFVKTESSGKDLVIFCYPTSENWTPKTALEKGIGGSEEAVINLSREFVAKGYNVTVYNSCGSERLEYDGVVYRPYYEWNYRDKQDIVILWRSALAADYKINADKVYVDLHDCLAETEFTQKRLEKIDKIFVKSNFHRSLFPNIEDEKFAIIPNGLGVELFNYEVERDPYLIINTSSPDRSIEASLKIFEMVKKEIPEAKMDWAYGWKGFELVHKKNERALAWMIEQKEKMKNLSGFIDLGRLSHIGIAKLYKEANVFLYPTVFAEIDCISARKAQLGGAYPVTTDFGALATTVKYGDKTHAEASASNIFEFGVRDDLLLKKMAQEVIKQLKAPLAEKNREQMKEWAGSFTWNNIAKQWIDNF